MVDLALHVEHRHAAVLGHGVQIAVADAPVDVADGDAIEITAKYFTDLFRSVTVRDLGGARFNERCMAAQVGHTCFKRPTGAGAAKEE